jgi:hypothetical protein
MNLKDYIQSEIKSVLTEDYDLDQAFNDAQPVEEGVMSELDILAKEAKDLKSFVKTVFKEFDNLPKNKETLKWLEGIYKDSTNESVNEIAEPQIRKIAELTGVSIDKVEKYVSSRVLNITKLLQYIKDEKQVAIRDFEKAVKGDKKQDAYFIKMFNESVNEAQKINPTSMKFLKGMKKIKVKGLGGYMPGVDYVYVDGDKYYFVDFEGDHMELNNTNTIKQLHKLHGNSLGESVNEGKMPKKYIGRDDIVYLKTKEDSKGANYNLYYKGHRIEFGDRRFGSEKELKDFAKDYILSNQWYNKLKYADAKSLPESTEQLDEKLITFSNRAPYGQIVFMAGGAGSGKGFAIDNFIDAAGFKVRDVDEMKTAVGKLDQLGKFSIDDWFKKYASKLPEEDRAHVEEFVVGKGMSISDVANNLKSPNNVAALHYIVDSMGLKDKWLISMLSGKTNKETLPNLLFDITAKKVNSITDVIKPLVDTGYDPKNIHLIWVLTDYHLAVSNNKDRDRVVPDDILLGTHEGAAKTIWGILTKGLPNGLNGRIDVILNNKENTVTVVDSKGKTIKVNPNTKNKLKEPKFVVKGFLSLPIKTQGGGTLPEKVWKELLYKWISDNGPKTIDLSKPLDRQMGK